MVEFLSRQSAELWGRENSLRAATIVEKAQRTGPASATFLSHSSKDVALLPRVVKILEDHGASVYLDKKDPSLPPYTSRKTAQILRDRVKKSKKFVLLATENSKDSRWVPWELGLGDGFKSPRNVALFPAVESQGRTAWTRAEYLGIYDRIVYGKHRDFSRPVWMVWDQDKNVATELSQWLRR